MAEGAAGGYLAAMDDALAAFIRENLPVLASAAVPEIRLHRAGPRSGLRRLADQDPEFASPYWAHAWGGGLVLARHLLDHPEIVAGRSVVDAGCGSGLVAIAAAQAGAASVLAVDVDPYAIVATRLNAELNGVVVEALLADVVEVIPPTGSVVLVGDLFYEPGLAERVLSWTGQCHAAGSEVLIGDPWRTSLPSERLALVAELSVEDFGEAARPAAVFRVQV